MALRQRAPATLTVDGVERILRDAGITTAGRAGPGVPPSFIQRLAETNDIGRVRLARDALRAVKPPAMLGLLADSGIAAAFIRDPKGFAFHLSQLGQCIPAQGVGAARQMPGAGTDDAARLVGFIRERSAMASMLAASPAAFVRIARLECSYEALRTLEGVSFNSAFRRSPDSFATAIEHISAHAGSGSATAFMLRLRQDRNMAQAFASAPSAFAAMAAATRTGFIASLESLGTGLLPDALIARAFSLRDESAIELGRHMDDLHDRPRARGRYLSGLGLPQVAGLLCSNPDFFFTSTNSLMFERLAREMPGAGIRRIRDAYGLNYAQLRNFVFRAINYGRLDGFLTGRDDISVAMRVITGARSEGTGIYSDTFDSRFFYLLANSIASVKRHAPDLAREIDARIRELGQGLGQRPESQRSVYHALRYARYLLGGPAGGDSLLAQARARSSFSIDDYRGRDGIVRVLQVFDREDTGNSHWPLTQRFFERGYRRVERRRARDGSGQETGTLITYERRGARVSLFMGDSEEANRSYARQWLSENATGMITFRGHSYSLAANMPPEAFGNRSGRYVFIPGSCGSAGSIPAYISSNPRTDLRFFSNTSTGRGQVTNALLDMLLSRRGSTTFQSILSEGASRITAAGGDPSLIRAINPGESLLNFVNLAVRAAPARTS